jgi:hypothetical protein
VSLVILHRAGSLKIESVIEIPLGMYMKPGTTTRIQTAAKKLGLYAEFVAVKVITTSLEDVKKVLERTGKKAIK